MNDGSYVNMIIKNYNSEEVYSMEELEKSKQKSADHEDEEVCCCGHHHHHDEHDDGTKNTAAADTITITMSMIRA